jgi:chromosome segregation ATPase
MDVRVRHTTGGLHIQADVCGIERGTELQRVKDAVQAVQAGMSAKKTVEPERSDWHLDSDIKTIIEQDQRLKSLSATIAAKDVAIVGLTADRKKLNVEIAHLKQTLYDHEELLGRQEKIRQRLADQADELRALLKSQNSLLKIEQDKLAASVKKHKATSRRLSTANKKLRELNQG